MDKTKKAVKKCKQDSEKKDDKIEELTSTLKRVQAEFDNYRKRVEKEREENSYYFKKEIITKLLPVIDMFDLALQHKDNKEEFIKGMEMIYSQFISTLENEGLEPIEVKKFNPELHEAVIAEESKEKEGTILDELQKGYKLNNKVIRCSRVKVAKKDAK